MSLTMARTSGKAALASAAVKYFFLPRTRFFAAIANLPFSQAVRHRDTSTTTCLPGRLQLRNSQDTRFLGEARSLRCHALAGAGFGGGGGSGAFVHTGSACSLDAATAVGFNVACPQAIS